MGEGQVVFAFTIGRGEQIPEGLVSARRKLSTDRRLDDAETRRVRRTDRQGDQVLERAVAELLEEGELQRHVRRVRHVYQRRRDILCAGLDRGLARLLSYHRPAGGMALWATAARGVDVEIWASRARASGLFFQTGSAFTFDGRPSQHLRLGFAVANERELTRAVEILPRTAPQDAQCRRRQRLISGA
jgi:GntR family transcriptional regulator/MocR family aminotransferase